MSTRSLNGLSNNIIYVNTLSAGDAINISSSSSTASTIAVDISKQSATTTVEDTDLFLVEEADGSIKKITGAHMKSGIEGTTVSLPLVETGNNIKLSTLSSYGSANQYLKMNSGGSALEWFTLDLSAYLTLTSLSATSPIVYNDSSGDFSLTTVPVSKGGTGQTTFTNGQLLIGNTTGNTLTKATLSEGNNIDITNSTGSISIALSSTLTGSLSFDTAATFSEGLYTKTLSNASSSGFVRFYYNNSTDYLDLHGPASGSSALSIFLPASAGTLELTANNLFQRSSNEVSLKDNAYNLLIGTTTNTNSRKLVVEGKSQFNDIIYSYGSSGTAGYINLYDVDKSNHTSLYPSEDVNVNITLPASTGTLCLNTGSTSITTVGTITSGTWQGSVIDDAYIANDLTISGGTVNNTVIGGSTPATATFTGVTANASLAVKNGVNPGYISFYEGSGSGTNAVTLKPTSDTITSPYDVYLPTTTGYLALKTDIPIVPSLTTSRNFGTSAGGSVSLGVNTQTLNLLGSTIQLDYTKPIEITMGGAGSDLIHFDTGFGGAAGAMVFGDKTYDSGIFGDDQIYLHTSDTGYKIEIDVGFGGITYTAPNHLFVGNISGYTNSNITTSTGDFGNSHSKFNYDGSAYTYLYDPSGVNGATSREGAYMSWHNNGTAIYLNTPAGGTSSGDYIGFSTKGSGAEIPKGRMEMTGNFKITGTVTENHTFCDERVKDNLQDYEANASELLNKLKIKSFNRKTFDNLKADENGILLPFQQRFSDKTYYDIGLVAQEILSDVPELSFLVENQDGGDIEPMSIPSWKPLTALCIKAIQEQKQQIDSLTNLVNEMKVTIDKLNSSTSFKEFKNK